MLPDRGFTGHEYLPWFKLYNMNGRLYDPVVGRFLEPDPVVQNTASTQNLNRYSYALNNPLKYVDPSGNRYINEMEDTYDGTGSSFWYRGDHYTQNGDGEWIGSLFGWTPSGGSPGTSNFGISTRDPGPSYEEYARMNALKGAVTTNSREAIEAILNGFNFDIINKFGKNYLVIWPFGQQLNVGKASNGGYKSTNGSVFAGTGISSTPGGNTYNIDAAVGYLEANAHASWKTAEGQCALYVRIAIGKGGINTNKHPVGAAQYGPYLEKWGFSSVNIINPQYLRGDIAVIQGYPGGTAGADGVPYGHMQMYNGSQWISDFKQDNFWPGPGYRKNTPSFIIYRFGN
ncbi:RHS repeat-associated core domain-containing protein [Draconibacterium sp.]|nr:RHS repeat-associated core domain-containing protein [Draconibacterium sp.]